ncbi:hypothetical protein [Chitinophaga defluvii]|uniref:Uncharacterized protein n=1 Tax=Chitinophaga defluvii TaxID=3163343 RepID=A0ABV2TAY1_9BACT
MKAIIISITGLLLSANVLMAQNTFPATGNVGIGTNSPAYNLDVNGTANTGTLLLNKRLVLAMPATSTDRGSFNPIWMGLRAGKNLFMDEEFATGTNTIRLYTNVSDGTITVTRVGGTDIPNASGYYLEVKTTGASSTNFGGIRQDFPGKLNGTFVHLFRAKLPVGYTLNAATNSMGTGGTRHWLTSNEGTGKWEDYAYVLQFGNGGTVSTGGYVFVTGAAPAASLTWQIASATIFDATALEDGANFLKNQETEDQTASFRISGNGFVAGNVGIGVTDTKGYKLAVGGSMIAERVKVKIKTAWPDYVFAPEYQLPSLQEVAAHIKQHQHLPDMPSAKEVAAEGIDLGEMNKKLLQKVEELTLYMIEMKTQMEQQEKIIETLKKQLK